MQIVEGELIPGVAIGEYYIGMKVEDLVKKIGDDYTEEYLGRGEWKIYIENAMIWINEYGFVDEIGVTRGFQSAYQGRIRIGTTLNEIEEMYGGYEEGYDTYNLIGVDGMCFQLEDEDDDDIPDDEWDERKVPIEWIFIYRIPEVQGSVTQIVEGQVIPGEVIGEYCIGMKKEDIIKKLGDNYTEEPLGDGKCKIPLENAMIWIDSDGFVEKIGVSKGFQGAYQYYLKIGTALKEVKEVFWEYEKVYGEYKLTEVDGLSFKLEDSDGMSKEEWDELKLPIEWIFVYRIPHGQ